MNYIKIDVIQGKFQLVESIFDVINAKTFFIGLTPGPCFEPVTKSYVIF